MKHLFFVVSLLTLSLMPSSAQASGYPADYCQQRVRLVSQGPTLLALVSSGCMSKLVIGYRKTGVLAQSNPKKIDALVTGSCQDSRTGALVQTTRILELGREWHGTGFVGAEEWSSSFFPIACEGSAERLIEIAFSDSNGQWDSLYGSNYQANFKSIWSAKTVLTNDFGVTVGLGSWAAIIQEMKR